MSSRWVAAAAAVAAGGGGIAMNDDGTVLASVDKEHNRVVFMTATALGFESGGNGMRGTAGSDGSELREPGAATFARRHDSDTLLVCDSGNERIVEMSAEGRLIRHLTVGGGEGSRPSGVAYSGKHDLIAVACSGHTVVLLRYESGEVVRRIGGMGCTDGKLNEPAGVRFTADGAHILVADYWNHRVSKFRIADGAFVTNVATEAVHGVTYPFDVLECDDGGSIVVACNVDGARGSSEAVLCEGSTGRVLANIAPWSFAHSPGVGFVAKELSGRLVQQNEDSDSVPSSVPFAFSGAFPGRHL
jgi:DNA-binding beta-propeller fold protein YncE